MTVPNEIFQHSHGNFEICICFMFRQTVTTAVSLRPFQVIAEKDVTAYFCHRSGVAWTVTLLCIAIPFSFFCLPKRIKREPICDLPGEMAKANTVSFLSGMLYQSTHHHDKEHVSFTCRTEKSHAFCIPAITCQKSQYIPSCYIKYY